MWLLLGLLKYTTLTHPHTSAPPHSRSTVRAACACTEATFSFATPSAASCAVDWLMYTG